MFEEISDYIKDHRPGEAWVKILETNVSLHDIKGIVKLYKEYGLELCFYNLEKRIPVEIMEEMSVWIYYKKKPDTHNVN